MFLVAFYVGIRLAKKRNQQKQAETASKGPQALIGFNSAGPTPGYIGSCPCDDLKLRGPSRHAYGGTLAKFEGLGA